MKYWLIRQMLTQPVLLGIAKYFTQQRAPPKTWSFCVWHGSFCHRRFWSRGPGKSETVPWSFGLPENCPQHTSERWEDSVWVSDAPCKKGHVLGIFGFCVLEGACEETWLHLKWLWGRELQPDFPTSNYDANFYYLHFIFPVMNTAGFIGTGCM